jgi:hypothetical protein
MKKYQVRLYYSTYIDKIVEANDEASAILTARALLDKIYNQEGFEVAYQDAIENLEPRKYGDIAAEIK